MKCPFCGHLESKVTDSRSLCETTTIRRRRECLECGKRFTTFETLDISLQVRKRDGSFEDFQIEKLSKGIAAAARHTRISHDQVRTLSLSIMGELMESHTREVPTTILGEMVMENLRQLDPVAYIRFACVYRRFKDVDEVMHAIQTAHVEETSSAT